MAILRLRYIELEITYFEKKRVGEVGITLYIDF